MLARVAAVGDAEAEVEVEALEEQVSEVVPLDHAEAVQGPWTHRELHAEKGTLTFTFRFPIIHPFCILDEI